MVTLIDRIALLPSVPAVYALYGGLGRHAFVAYVGKSDHLRRRIEQHLERNNSSITSRDAAVILNTRQITEVRWWSEPDFDDHIILEAAEHVALEILLPVLRSQGRPNAKSKELAERFDFRTRISGLLEISPAGRLIFPTLQDALDRISLLERRIAALESANQSGCEAPAGSASLSGI